ncbi:peptidylprolyl isomerase [candidate division KSB1 bacterium]|nr:peptidylprolyl isomerase [candidate division KSB1 bacterium]
MAVMHKMRENMHIILFFLLIMFLASMTIGGLVGGANILDLLSGRKPDTILEVNGQQISYEQYNRVRQNQMENYRQQNEQEPTGYQLQQLEDQIWEGMIVDVLKQQTVEKLGLNVTDEEVKYFILKNPHPIIKMDQNFANENGEFDPEKYQAALGNPQADNFWMYKEQQLRMFVPYEKLENELKATVRVTDAELKEEYQKKNDKVNAKYIFFDIAKYPIADDQISDAEINAYYNDHTEDFKEDEQRKIRYALFSTQASAKDSVDVRKLAQTLADSARKGADFVELAELYSEDPGSVTKGGDLGYFKHGVMVKPFEDAAFAAKKSEIVGPVETVHGLHILKVEDKRQENGEEEVKARHILLKFKASRDTEESAREYADYFEREAANNGFSAMAASENVKIDTTDYFRNTGFIPGLGVQKTIVMKAFHQKPGETSRVYNIENRGFIVFEVIGIKPAAVQPLADVKNRVVAQVRRQKQLERAKTDATEVRSKIYSPEQFDTVAAEDSLQVKVTDFFNIDGYIQGVGRDPKFNGAAFELDVNEISQPVEGNRGYYIIMVTEKQNYDPKTFAASKDEFKKEIMQRKLQYVYSDWLASMKAKSDIEDFRYIFY